MSQPLRALPELTSEPFQEEIVVLRGQGGEHVLEVLAKLRGERRGTVSRAGDVAPSLPHPPGLKFVPRAAGRTGHSLLPSLAGDRPQASCQAQGVSKPVPLRKGTSNLPPPHPPSTKHPPLCHQQGDFGMEPDPGHSSHTTAGTTEVGRDLGAPRWPGGTRCQSLGRGTTQIPPGPRRTSPVTRLTGLSPPAFRCN